MKHGFEISQDTAHRLFRAGERAWFYLYALENSPPMWATKTPLRMFVRSSQSLTKLSNALAVKRETVDLWTGSVEGHARERSGSSSGANHAGSCEA